MSLGVDSTVAVVGASLAGLRACEALREEGYGGRIVVVGAEPEAFYDRPPLSKQYLAGKWDRDRIRLRPTDPIHDLGLELRPGHRAVELDPQGAKLTFEPVPGAAASSADGGPETVEADGIVIACGARPRRLPGTEGLDGVHILRTLADAQRISAAIGDGDVDVVVIGAGFIGSEVASTCAARGARVTVLEAGPVPLARVLGEQIGSVCASLHETHGVTLRCGVGVEAVRGVPGGLEVALNDGATLRADVVVVGVGVAPETGWLESSGLALDNGVVVDEALFAADRVVAAGDVANFFDRAAGEQVRIEHWTNAAEQGAHAAKNLLAGRRAATPYWEVPYFWSDQYDVKIQMIGRPHPGDDVVVVEGTGSLEEGRFVALYGGGGGFHAAIGIGRPRQLMGYRTLLAERATFDGALAHKPT